MSKQKLSAVSLVPTGKYAWAWGESVKMIDDHRTSDGVPHIYCVGGEYRVFDDEVAAMALDYLVSGKAPNDRWVGDVAGRLPKEKGDELLDHVCAKKFAEYRARVSKNQPWSES